MEPGGINLTGANAPVFIKAFSKNADAGSVPLRPGDIIQAKVTAFSQGSAVLHFGSLKIPVSTQLAMNPGDVLSLLVIELKPERVVLKRLDSPNMMASSTKYSKQELAAFLLKCAGFSGGEISRMAGTLMGRQIDTGSGLEGLIKNLSQSMADGMTGVNTERLLFAARAVLIEESDDAGVIEGKIKEFLKAIDSEAALVRYLEDGDGDIDNLKAALLEARATLQVGISAERADLFAGLRASLEKVLDLVNATKTLNLPIESQARDMIYIPLPIKVGDELRTAEIRIYMRGDKDESKAGRGTRVAVGFALEMPSLGKTRALLEARGTTIDFSISFQNSDALSGIRDHLQELKGALEGLGYSVGKFSASELAVDEPAGSLVEEKMGVQQAGIDVRA